jgi:hypothetical protein
MPVDVEPQTTAEDMMSEWSGETGKETKERGPDEPRRKPGGRRPSPTNSQSAITPAPPDEDPSSGGNPHSNIKKVRSFLKDKERPAGGLDS